MPERGDIKVDGVYDIETETYRGKIRFKVGDVYLPPHHHVFENARDMVSFLLRTKGVLWAHYGGQFDALFVLGEILKRKKKPKLKIVLAGGGILLLKAGPLLLRDSWRLSLMSLDKFSEIGEIRKQKFDVTDNAKIKRGSRAYKKLIEYLKIDCESLYSALQGLRKVAEDNDLDLGNTIGASSARTAKRWLGLGDPEFGKRADYDMARRALVGGRTEVGRVRIGEGHYFDINSAYPAAMRELFPCGGAPKWMPARQAWYYFNREYGGMYCATVRVPPCHFPPLPYRLKDRLAFPWGEFKGLWTGIELQHALESGTELVRIHYGLVWPDMGRVLAPFISRLWPMRQAAGPSTPLGKWFKGFTNSFYGKTAQSPWVEKIAIDPKDDSGMRCLDPMGEGRFFSFDVDEGIPWCGFIQLGAYITAYTRILLHKAIAPLGDDFIYCDTDSVLAGKLLPDALVGAPEDLGKFKYEGKITLFESLGPKAYAFRDGKGRFTARAKGIPDAEKNWEHWKNHEPVEPGFGVNAFKSAISRKDPENTPFFALRQIMRTRKETEFFGSRRIVGDRTEACDVKELEERFGKADSD